MENQDSRNVPDLIPLTMIEEQPRARDLDIAERLGFQRPRAIRQVIERNRTELEGFGPLATQHGKSRGHCSRGQAEPEEHEPRGRAHSVAGLGRRHRRDGGRFGDLHPRRVSQQRRV
jgi:hypothetical protein